MGGVIAVVVLGVGQDGLAGHLVEGDVLGRQLGRGGDDGGIGDTVRILQRPRQGLHAAQRTADHSGELLDAEHVGEAGLRGHPVFHGHEGKVRAIRRPGGRVNGGGTGAAVAAAEIVHPDHEEFARIERLAGANEVVPPANVVGRIGVIAGHMVGAGQRVTHQHRIAAIGVQLAIGLVDQFVFFEAPAALEQERLGKALGARCDDTDGLRLRHGDPENKKPGRP
jgi:hypothetical protein